MPSRPTPGARGPRARALDAFRVLMLERGYRRVTVQNVLDRAQIGRATFYTHFRCKEDLLAASVAGLGASLGAAWVAARASGNVEPFGFARALLRHAASSRRMLGVLAEEGTDVLLREHMLRMLAQLARQELELRGPLRPDVHDEALVQFVVGALWSLLMWWSRVPGTAPDEVADMFVRLVTPTCDSAFATPVPKDVAAPRRGS